MTFLLTHNKYGVMLYPFSLLSVCVFCTAKETLCPLCLCGQMLLYRTGDITQPLCQYHIFTVVDRYHHQAGAFFVKGGL